MPQIESTVVPKKEETTLLVILLTKSFLPFWAPLYVWKWGYLLLPGALFTDQKYFGKLTLSPKVFNEASLKKIGDLEFGWLFVTYRDSLLTKL